MITSEEFHAEELWNCRRVCVKWFSRGGTQQQKTITTPGILIAYCYNTDLDNDEDNVHPPDVCHAYLSHMRWLKAAQGLTFSRSEAFIFEWAQHTAEYSVCAHFQKTLQVGRPRKQQPVGRQSSEPISHTLTTLQDVIGPSIVIGVSPS